MVCAINTIQNCQNAFNYKRHNIPAFCGNLVKLSTNVCQFTKPKYSERKLLTILKGDFKNLTKAFFDSLSDKEYQLCLKYAKSNERRLNPTMEDVMSISNYCDFLIQGIKNIAPDKKVKVISVGQSPSVLCRALSLKGVDTAIIPISNLNQVKNIEDIAQKPEFNKYCKYLKKNFNIDLDNLDKNTTHIFTDYSLYGVSLQNFKRILDARNIKGENIKVLSLQDIIKHALLPLNDYEFAKNFQLLKLKIIYLKTLYSPIFKMPITDINNIAQIHKNSQNATTRRGNKLQILLYDYLKFPQKHRIQRSASFDTNMLSKIINRCKKSVHIVGEGK